MEKNGITSSYVYVYINRTNITRDDTTYVRWNCYILIFFNESLGVKKEVSKSILVFPAIFYKVIGIYELNSVIRYRESNIFNYKYSMLSKKFENIVTFDFVKNQT